MKNKDAKSLLNYIYDYVTSLGWGCSLIEDEIPAVKIDFDMTIDNNKLSQLAEPLKKEEYVLAFAEIPEDQLSYSGTFEIMSPVQLTVGTTNATELLLMLNQVNQTIPIGNFFVKYNFGDGDIDKMISESVIWQKYSFTFSNEEEFPMETLCEILLLLLELKRMMETMIVAIHSGRPVADVVAFFTDYSHKKQ